MNVAIGDSNKRTSISQLLNPLGNDSPEATPQSSISLERTPAPTSPNVQNAQNGGESSLIPSPSSSSFQLRSASWEQRNSQSTGTDGLDSSRPFHYIPYSESPGGDVRGTSRSRDGASNSPGRGGAWPARHEVPNMPYGTPVIAPMYSAERTPISGNFGSSQPRNYNQGSQSDKSSGHSTSAPWQTTERASTRLVARGTAKEHATIGQHPYPVRLFPGFVLPPIASEYPPPRPVTQSSDMPSPQPAPAQKSQKRQAPDGQDSSSGPKLKKTKSKAKTPADGSSSKRGYNAKKRSEAAQIAAQNALIPSVSYSPQQPNEQVVKATRIDQDLEGSGALHPELQFARCMSNRYKSETFPRCVACTRRWAGDTCRFQGIRFLLKDNNRKVVGISFVENEKADAPTMTFPVQWNVPLKPEHIRRTKRAVALSLLPTLRQEMTHLETPEIIRRPRESDVRATCDTCMTSLFSSSWMCRVCGREACAECFETVRELTEERESATTGDTAALQLKREKHAHSNPFFLSCTKRIEHGVKDFSPMSRFCKTELGDAIAEMEALLKTPDVDALPVDSAIDPSLDIFKSPLHTNGTFSHEDSTVAGLSNVETVVALTDKPTQLDGNLANTAQIDPSLAFKIPAEVPSHPAKYYTHEELTDSVFRPLWQKGEPLVVTGLSSKFQIPWTPDYFIEKHGTQSCLIVECQTDVNKRITVGEFFTMFGKYEGRTECWKLKDWPSSTDFKTVFPELYDDFSQAVPVPDYVRRDGTLNIASHFPLNTIGPDLGPKMYNAMAAFQTVGGKGSTRLHMDMSDALNIMTFASSTPDGNPGTAAWDLFRAEDSTKLRHFLKKKFRSNLPLHDPIHSQQFYLDTKSLAELWKDYGVKSFRIYQKPGEAIFIPAGCAHQVSNMADCIKVAIDFVSPENIARCENLTKEFREQNQSMVWKEDVLQLRTMMWYAWLSCRMQEKGL